MDNRYLLPLTIAALVMSGAYAWWVATMVRAMASVLSRSTFVS